MTASVGPPIRPEGEGRRDTVRLRDLARAAIATHLARGRGRLTAAEVTADGNPVLVTACDPCGRSEESDAY